MKLPVLILTTLITFGSAGAVQAKTFDFDNSVAQAETTLAQGSFRSILHHKVHHRRTRNNRRRIHRINRNYQDNHRQVRHGDRRYHQPNRSHQRRQNIRHQNHDQHQGTRRVNYYR